MSVVTPFTAGAGLGAGQLNGFLAAWDTYTPTLTNMTVGNGSIGGRYFRQGKTVALRIVLNAGSTTTYAASGVQIGLPVAAASGEQGLLLKLFTGSGSVLGTALLSGTAAFPYVVTSGTNANLIPMSSSTPNLGTSGNLWIQGTYECA